MDLKKYIEDRSIPVPFVGCWMWMLSLGSHGYGNAYKSERPGERVVVAHRLAYEAFRGPIPPGLLVQHSCDNKWCVNPDHLSVGTDKTNSDDKWSKGRANMAARRGQPNPLRKLSDGQADEIRRSADPIAKTAERFGVNKRVVWNIRHGRSYVHRKAS